MPDNNYNYHDYPMDSISVNEPHQPVLFACDRSGSMYGKPVANLIKSVNRFKSDVCKDEKAARCVDIAVVSFNHETNVEQNWRPITQMDPVNFNADGGTDLSSALELGTQMLRDRGHYYDDNGIEVRMPYLILITDGYGGDVTEIAETIKQRTADHKMQLWVLAVKGYDKATIAQLTDGKRVFELVDEDGFNFDEFFDFMAASVRAVSTSSPNQRIIVKSNIGNVAAGSNCQVPNLDAWLN